MNPVPAHLICIGLVAADFAARGWRIQVLLKGLRHPIGFWQALAVNATGEAACAVTPARLGGEPARIAGMLHSGVPAEAAFVAVTYEVLGAWPFILVFAVGLGMAYAPEWLAQLGPHMVQGSVRLWPWLAVIVAFSLLLGVTARRLMSPWLHHVKRPVMRLRVYWRRMPVRFVLASLPFSVINLVSRVAILPILVLTLPDPPALGPVFFGSFLLLYSQLILPTPAGLGMVDFGFWVGAAGHYGAEQAGLLLLWRFYTSIVGVLLGAYFAVRLYGAGTVRAVARRFARPAGGGSGG